MSGKFDNILDECLERLLVQDETIEQCLQSYPEQAAELKPLLQTALFTIKAIAVHPRAEFKAGARYQFHSALREMSSRKNRLFLSFSWFPRWVTVAAIILGILMIGDGTTIAARYSMPDSFLYPIKLAVEQVQLSLTFSDTGKANLNAELADRRVNEIIYIANKGDAQKIEAITQQLDKRLKRLASLTSLPEVTEPPMMMKAPPAAVLEEATSSQEIPDSVNIQTELRETVANHAINQPAGLRAALRKAPESVKPALRHAIAVLEAGYKKALRGWD